MQTSEKQLEEAMQYVMDNPHNSKFIEMNQEHIIGNLYNGIDFFYCKECGALEYDHYGHYEAELKPKQQCFYCNFWLNKLPELVKPNVFIINHKFYSDAGNSPNEKNSSFLGFAGHKFTVKKGDKVTETNNMWSAGDIPERFWHLFPDNATMYETNKSEAVTKAAANLKKHIFPREL